MRLDGIGEETPVFFPAGPEILSGIAGTPAGSSTGVGVIVLPGAWRGTSAGRNAALVRLCHRLMAAGYHTLRFDYAGIGESTGIQTRELTEPSVEDAAGAAAWLRAHGPSRVILVGFCYGGWTALFSTPRIEGLHGVALLVPPVDTERPALAMATQRVRLRRVIRQAMHPSSLRELFSAERRRLYARYLRTRWQTIRRRAGRRLPGGAETPQANAEFLDLLASLVDRRVPVLFLYGTEDFEYEGFERARAGRLGEILAAAGASIDVTTVPGYLHGLAEVDAQGSLVDAVTDWVVRQVPPSVGADELARSSSGPATSEAP